MHKGGGVPKWTEKSLINLQLYYLAKLVNFPKFRKVLGCPGNYEISCYEYYVTDNHTPWEPPPSYSAYSVSGSYHIQELLSMHIAHTIFLKSQITVRMQTGKLGKIIIKSPKVCKVRESKGIGKKCCAWSGKVRENFLSKYLI